LQVRCLNFLDIIYRKLCYLDLLRQQIPKLLEQALAFGEHGYYGIALANQGWLAWRDGDEMNAMDLCHAAMKYWNQTVGVYPMQSMAVWVLLAIAVSNQDIQESEHWTQLLLDPNPILQPILEPMVSLLAEALSAGKRNEAQAAFQLFNQVLETAKAASEL
jgi:hypothetical protein